ncbi:hypothetical protein FQZ97_665960 [compost metagenome]
MRISFCSSRMSCRICAWIVTSSAVVGSSAISSCGLHDSAIAIITRWRMPPESWCGKRSSTLRASGMRTSSSMRSASARAAELLLPWWMRMASAIWSPAVNTGFSEVIGSWKIIAMSAPRMPRIVLSRACARSSTSPLRRRKAMLPPRMRPPPCSTSRISASEVTDLPDPDSPTTASVSPWSTWKDSFLTASTVRSEVEKRTVRSSTARTRPSGRFRAGEDMADAGEKEGGRQAKMAVTGASSPRAWPRYMPSVLKARLRLPWRSTAIRPPVPPMAGSDSCTTACVAASSVAPP